MDGKMLHCFLSVLYNLNTLKQFNVSEANCVGKALYLRISNCLESCIIFMLVW